MTATVVGWWAEESAIAKPANAALAIVGGTPGVVVTNDRKILPSTASLFTVGRTPNVQVSDLKSVEPGTAASVITGGVPDVRLAMFAQPSTRALTLTMGAPVVVASDHKVMTPASAALTLSAKVPSVAISDNKLTTPTTGALIVTGNVPAIALSDNKFITPTTQGLVLTRGTPAVAVAPFQAGVFDAQGTGTQAQSASWSYQHTATAGAYVIVALTVDRAHTVNNVTYDGVSMSLLGNVNHNNDSAQGATKLYGLPNAPGGTKTVAISISTGGAWACSNSFSYRNVKSVNAIQTVNGFGTPLFHTVASDGSQYVVQAFGKGTATGQGSGGFANPAGGTNRFNRAASGSGGSASTTVSDTPGGSSVTFSVDSIGGNARWGGIAALLGP